MWCTARWLELIKLYIWHLSKVLITRKKILQLYVSHSVVSNSLRSHGLQLFRLFGPWLFQARIQEWVAIPFSRGSFWPRYQTSSPVFPALTGGFFTTASPKVSKMTYVTSLIWKTAVIWIRQTYMYLHRNILSMYWLLRKKIKQNVIYDMLTIAQYVYGNGYVNS